MTPAAALDVLRTVPALPLAARPSPVEELPRLREALGGGPRLLVKRDDALSFALGGNKVRKLELFAAAAREAGADMLITAGGVQSNHARVTAGVAAKIGMRCTIVASGEPPARLTANALLDRLFGAEIEYVDSRLARAARLESLAAERQAAGDRPYVIPVGGSTPLGALAFVRAVDELRHQGPPPDVIVHSTSSGGTQAGLVAGCALMGLPTRVIGISADEPQDALQAEVGAIVSGVEERLGMTRGWVPARCGIEVDADFVGGGYGRPTAASGEAIDLAARTEALLVDHTYSAKALAGLIARVRDGRFRAGQTILFWHTGGQVALFA